MIRDGLRGPPISLARPDHLFIPSGGARLTINVRVEIEMPGGERVEEFWNSICSIDTPPQLITIVTSEGSGPYCVA